MGLFYQQVYQQDYTSTAIIGPLLDYLSTFYITTIPRLPRDPQSELYCHNGN
jgi:hypothetical protein